MASFVCKFAKTSMSIIKHSISFDIVSWFWKLCATLRCTTLFTRGVTDWWSKERKRFCVQERKGKGCQLTILRLLVSVFVWKLDHLEHFHRHPSFWSTLQLPIKKSPQVNFIFIFPLFDRHHHFTGWQLCPCLKASCFLSISFPT